jgi:hypothetical protein
VPLTQEKFVFVCDTELSILYSQMAGILKLEDGLKSLCVTIGKTWEDFNLKSQAFDKVYNLSSYLYKNWDKLDTSPAYLEALENKYGFPNLWQLIFMDRDLIHFPYQKNLKFLSGHFKFWEELIEKEKPTILIAEPSILNALVGYIVATKHGVKYLNQTPTFFTGRIGLSTNPYFYWKKAIHLYEQYKSSGIPKEIKDKAVNWLNKYKNEKQVPTFMQRISLKEDHVRLVPNLNLKTVKHAWTTYYRTPEEEFNYRYIKQHPLVSLVKGRMKYFQFKHLLKKEQQLFEAPDLKEKFILYPLHVEPETTVLIQSLFYSDQLALIKQIAMSIPLDCRLYVKEHPAMYGLRDIKDYKRLKQLPNVVLIRYDANTHDLIRNCQLVTTLTGTVGLEALFYNKPVIMFGKTYYSYFDKVFKVKDIRELPVIIKEGLNNYQPDEELLLKFLAALLEGTYEGVFYNAINDPETNSLENARKILAAIKAELNFPYPE